MQKIFVFVILFIVCSIFTAGCGPTEVETAAMSADWTPTPRPTPTNTLPPQPEFPSRPIPLIYDDDGSPDGTLANLYLLANPDVDLKGISISYGEATPSVYIQHIGNMLDVFGITGIQLGAGENAPLAGNNAFPAWITEAADKFWHIQIPNAGKKYPAQPAADVIIDTVKNSPEPVTLYFAGAYTSLAQALRDDPSIVDNIHAVYLMGGAVYAPGNIHDFYPDDPNEYAEWNIYADPQAAKEVFESGMDLYLIPLDATNKVMVSNRDTKAWRGGGQIGNLGADLWDGIMSTWTVDEGSMWDVTAAIAMLNPEFCPFIPLHLDVVTEEGAHIGQTAVVPGAEPNIGVCLDPDADNIRQHLIEVFSSSP
jgi:purine nucleosidase/pyrimidine-specific ribonucleoside hydrolase